MACLKNQLKKSQIQIYKKEGDMNVMEKGKAIPSMECNTVLTTQYTFPNRVFSALAECYAKVTKLPGVFLVVKSTQGNLHGDTENGAEGGPMRHYLFFSAAAMKNHLHLYYS